MRDLQLCYDKCRFFRVTEMTCPKFEDKTCPLYSVHLVLDSGINQYLNEKKHGFWKYDRGYTADFEVFYCKGKYHSHFKNFYMDGEEKGRIAEKGTYHNDKKVGTWIKYYRDGTIQDNRWFSYKTGREEGNAYEYWPNGKLKKHQLFNEKGFCVFEETFKEDGRLENRQEYEFTKDKGIILKNSPKGL